MVAAPLRKALGTTLIVALAGLVWRFVGAVVNPELRSWALVAIAPFVGFVIYRRETGRAPIPPVAMLALGGGLQQRARKVALAMAFVLAWSASNQILQAQTSPQPIVRTRVRGPFRVEDQTIAAFVPAVAAVDLGGGCSPRPSIALPAAGRMLIYNFGQEQQPARRVLLRLDSTGQVLSYSDMRGSTTRGPEPDSTAGPGTSVSYSAYEPGIFVRNINSSVMPGRFRLFGPDALTAPNLGPIGLMTERILRECDGR